MAVSEVLKGGVIPKHPQKEKEGNCCLVWRLYFSTKLTVTIIAFGKPQQIPQDRKKKRKSASNQAGSTGQKKKIFVQVTSSVMLKVDTLVPLQK